MTCAFTREFAKVIACDLDAGFLERCHETVGRFGKPDRLQTLHVADGHSLDLRANTADVAFSYITFQHCDPDHALDLSSEAVRVVKPGGKVALNYRSKSGIDTIILPLSKVMRAMFKLPGLGGFLSRQRVCARLGWQANRLQPDEIIGPLSPLLRDIEVWRNPASRTSGVQGRDARVRRHQQASLLDRRHRPLTRPRPSGVRHRMDGRERSVGVPLVRCHASWERSSALRVPAVEQAACTMMGSYCAMIWARVVAGEQGRRPTRGQHDSGQSHHNCSPSDGDRGHGRAHRWRAAASSDRMPTTDTSTPDTQAPISIGERSAGPPSAPTVTEPPATEAAIDPAEIPETPCEEYVDEAGYPLKPCDSGTLVETLQRDLESLFPTIAIDGLYGGQTFGFIEEIQTAIGDEVTGLVSEELAGRIADAESVDAARIR